MKCKTTEIARMDAAELIRERARILARIRKYEKEELPADAWLCEPAPDVCYIQDLERLIDVCNAQIAISEPAKK